MIVKIDLPDYDENGIDIIWEEGSRYHIMVSKETVEITANKNALISIAKQMLYLAYNDLPSGSHVHLDSFFTGQQQDVELTIARLDNVHVNKGDDTKNTGDGTMC